MDASITSYFTLLSDVLVLVWVLVWWYKLEIFGDCEATEHEHDKETHQKVSTVHNNLAGLIFRIELAFYHFVPFASIRNLLFALLLSIGMWIQGFQILSNSLTLYKKRPLTLIDQWLKFRKI